VLNQNLVYISDQRYFCSKGKWYTSNGFPIAAAVRAAERGGVHIGKWIFFGRIVYQEPPDGALEIEPPPGVQVDFIGPHTNRRGLFNYGKMMPEYVRLLRCCIKESDLIWLKANFFASWVSLPFLSRSKWTLSHQVGDPAKIMVGPRLLRRPIRAIAAALCRRVHRKSRLNVFVSRDLKSRYGLSNGWVYNESRVVLADVEKVNRARARADESKNILFVGRLSPEKGLSTLLDALCKLPETVHLTVAGSGTQMAQLQLECERKQLSRRVAFLGTASWGPQLFSLMRASDVLVLPSFTEGLPLVLIEAMANGLPVIASAVGGIPEIVEDGISGLLVPPGDHRSLALAIERFITDDDLRARIQLGGFEIARANTMERQLLEMFTNFAEEITREAPSRSLRGLTRPVIT
jgi:glycosyltransferase involved in cell wall biosynthesis